MSQQYPQGQQGWGPQQPPQWGGQQPKKSSAGKVVGLSCLGVVGLLVVVGAIGAVASGGDDDGDRASSKPSAVSESAEEAAPEDEVEPAEKPEEEPVPAKGVDPDEDVKITKCEVDPTLQWPSASLDVTNRSSKSSNYIISVEFVDKDGTRLGEGTAALNNLAPGQVSKEKAQGLTQVSGKVTCKVTKVTRYAS